MLAMKKKAAAKSAQGLFGGASSARTKRHALGKVPAQEESEAMDSECEDEECTEEEAEAQEEPKESKTRDKQSVASEEAVANAKRQKELKAMYVDKLKEVATSAGLPTGKREDMIYNILKHEAKARAQVREHEAQARAVVVQKKEELEAQSVAELMKRCASAGIKCASKPERVEQLLKHWLKEDGISKALAQEARNAREKELSAMEKQALQKICAKEGLNPFVKDIIVERIVERESSLGKFSVPGAKKEQREEAAPNLPTTGDVVESLLAKRKRDEKVATKEKADAEMAIRKMKELRAKSVDELKKLLVRKGMEVSGRKEEMVEVLSAAFIQDDAVRARKAELEAMDKKQLTELLACNGLQADKRNDTMVKAVLDHESKLRDELKAFESKMVEISTRKVEEFKDKTGAELKELCVAKGLPAGAGKEDRAKNLVEAARKDGELDRIFSNMARHARVEALKAMEESALVQLCGVNGADPLVKEVMIGRILAHENEVGYPMAKKARK